ncbi:MAG: hypothetical protein JWR63_2868, partial [Conexibacter sp.]|nr:hypothetical protein [Conexibacter sp.]
MIGIADLLSLLWRGGPLRQELVVAAGAARVVRVTGHVGWWGRRVAGCPQLVVDGGDAGRLTGGVERWEGRRLRWGLVEWRVRVAASRAT